ncbi:hypothetical protein Cgig2_017397 [Carnegiea gigantea]|uniref:Uncharacterized protein n=1 Tax=Carnegiea gigantea TaxID=171969 RepID=A0A9Q1JKI2_9CARY|nr:hypothetical protein Cgig2_017397 [Carnegiea gigantea]
MNATVLVPRATEENECEENPMPRNQSIARTITHTQNTEDDPISGANPPYEVIEGYMRRIWKHLAIDKVVIVRKGLFMYRPNNALQTVSTLLTEILFVAVAWQIWNARNRFIFKRPDDNLSRLSRRAIEFVVGYREAKDKAEGRRVQQRTIWRPPLASVLKLNFDGGKMGEDEWLGPWLCDTES